MLKVFPCLMVLCLAASSASALTITSGAPGNVFTAGSSIMLTVKEAQGAVSYELVDYFGSKIAEGRAVAAIRLPGLQPGWYELKCKDDAVEASVCIGVVMDRGAAPLPADGKVCIDVAAAWLVDKSKYESVARLVRTAGIPWVRERLTWGGSQKESGGPFDWTHYPKVADSFAAQGIRISQVWHDSPRWTHPDRTGLVSPNDLRDVYRFARTAASRFSHQIQAWEVWNEPDINPFWLDLSDRFSGTAKAAYLGFRDGNPRALVLNGSFCRGVSMFTHGFYESGCADYFDVFNWHTYKDPSTYPEGLAAHLALLGRYGDTRCPVWVTESGLRIEGTEGPDKRILSSANQRRQCQFMPRSLAMSIAAGNDRHFYFVLPHYIEGELQFGALRPDLTPYPSFVALSAAANILGQASYKGEYRTGDNGAVAHLFSTPTGSVLVAWSDTESEITVPTDRRTVRIADIFGRESSLAAHNGAVKVKTGPEALYLLDAGRPVERKLTGKPRPVGTVSRPNPSRLVLVGHCDLPIMKAADAYKITDQTEFDYTVGVYNLSENSGARGTVEVVAPAGWTVSNAKRAVALAPMGREVFAVRLRTGVLDETRFKLTVRGDFGREKVAPCVSSFAYGLRALTPARSQPLDWATDAARWKPNASRCGTVSVSSPETGRLRFDTSFTGPGERWAYPALRFERPVDMSGFEGVAFDLNVPEADPGTYIRMIFVEKSGAHYSATTFSYGGEQRIVFAFANLERLEAMGADPNGMFNPDSVVEVKLGCSAGRNQLVFECSGFELVGLR